MMVGTGENHDFHLVSPSPTTRRPVSSRTLGQKQDPERDPEPTHPDVWKWCSPTTLATSHWMTSLRYGGSQSSPGISAA